MRIRVPQIKKTLTRTGSSEVEKGDMASGSWMIDMSVRRTSTQLKAARLLDSWISGDRRGLDHELNDWREGRLIETDPTDEGREDLLRCLVEQMMDEPDLFAPRGEKLHLGVWVDLLVHLAHPELLDLF
jgi:hypothetical protein